MTVCIGAISHPLGAIVAVSDMMLSDDVSSADVAAYKLAPMFKGDRWWCMYSGLPTEAEELGQLLAGTDCPRTAKDAVRAIEHAYDGLTTHIIERRVLAPLGLARDEFIKDGLEIFGESYFKELTEECRRAKPETDLLVMGFDIADEPHIFEARRDGVMRALRSAKVSRDRSGSVGCTRFIVRERCAPLAAVESHSVSSLRGQVRLRDCAERGYDDDGRKRLPLRRFRLQHLY